MRRAWKLDVPARAMFGLLVVVVEKVQRQNGHRIFKCRCKCGRIVDVQLGKLTSGRTKTCGQAGCKGTTPT